MSYETPEGWSDWGSAHFSGLLRQAPTAALIDGQIMLCAWQLDGGVARYRWSSSGQLSATGSGGDGEFTSRLGIAAGRPFGRSPLGTPQEVTWNRRSTQLSWEIVASNGLASAMLDGPAAVAHGSDRLDLFFVRPDSSLCRLPVEPEVRPDHTLGVGFQGTPAAATWSSGAGDEVQVFVRGVDNALWCIYSRDGAWISQRLGGVVTDGPSLASWGPGRLDCFVLNGDGSISDWWWDGDGSCGRWDFPGPFLGSPSVLAVGPGHLHLWAVTWGGRLFHSELVLEVSPPPVEMLSSQSSALGGQTLHAAASGGPPIPSKSLGGSLLAFDPSPLRRRQEGAAP